MAPFHTKPAFMLATLAAAALLVVSGCDSASSGGGDVLYTPPGTTGGGQEQSFFGKFASGRQATSASRANDSATTEVGGGSSGAQAPCVPNPDAGSQCPTPAPGTPGGSVDIEMPQIPVCTNPLPVTAGVAKPCGDFCHKAGSCLEATPAETSMCASECESAMTGVKAAAVTEFFACFQSATCEEV